MYKLPYKNRTSIKLNDSVQGDTLETKILKATTQKAPLDAKAKLLYTERKAGILASTNIRTDRFEIAVEAADKIAKSYAARREEKPLKVVKDNGEAEPVQGEAGKTGTDSK